MAVVWVDTIDCVAPRRRIVRATTIETTTQRPSDGGWATRLVVSVAMGRGTKARGRVRRGVAATAIAMTGVEGMRWDGGRG